MANQEYLVRNRMTHWQKSYPHWVSVVSIIGVLLVWELICRAGFVSSLFLPAPSQIISSLFVMIGDGEIGMSLAASMYRILVGFAVGSLIGLAVGLVTGTSALADKIGNPIVNALYPIPKIALLPLFILWLGIGELSKVTIIAMGVFFPVAMNTYSGVKNVDTLLIKVAVSFNASWWKTMKSVVLWGTIVMILGVGTLMKVIQNAGGIDLLCNLLSGVMSSATVAPFTGITAGIMSLVSSGLGVVYPTLIPMASDLVASAGGGQPVAVIAAIVAGGSLAGFSPMSTCGALTLSAMGSFKPDMTKEEQNKSFIQLFVIAMCLILWVGISAAIFGNLCVSLFG